MAVRRYALFSLWGSYVLLLLAFYLILTRNDMVASQLSNADQLYFEEIYRGLFIDHISIHRFLFMAAPDFLHLALYFACRAVLPVQDAFVIATLLTIWFFYILFLRVTRFISTDPSVLQLYRGVLLLGITLLALPYFWIMGSFNQALFYSDHFLNIGVMNLLSLWLILKILFQRSSWQPAWLILLFVCIFITSVSDPAYLSCFSGPALLALGLLYMRQKIVRPHSIFFCCLIIAVASAMGYFLLKHLAIVGIQVNYSYMVFHKGMQLIKMLMQISKGFVLFFLNNVVLFLLWIWAVLYLLRTTENPRWYFIKNFILAGIICGMGAILFFDPDITPDSSSLDLNLLFFRHASPAIYFPIFFALPLMIEAYCSLQIKWLLARYALQLVFICQILIFIWMPSVVHLGYLFGPPAKNWPWLICVNQAKAEYHLQAGMSGYWGARPVSLLANLPMVQLQPDLSPDYWLTNIQSFNQKTFNFIVIDMLHPEPSESTVIQKYGPAAKTISCSIMKLLIYPQGITYDASAS